VPGQARLGSAEMTLAAAATVLAGMYGSNGSNRNKIPFVGLLTLCCSLLLPFRHLNTAVQPANHLPGPRCSCLWAGRRRPT
jgi:hypothetical protein